MTARETIIAREREVWEALKAGDPAADARLLSEDFLGVYPSGFAGRAAHAGQLEGGPTVSAYALHEVDVEFLSDDLARITYDARYSVPQGAEAERRMFVTSLWRRRGGEWLNTFSQDTPAAPDT